MTDLLQITVLDSLANNQLVDSLAALKLEAVEPIGFEGVVKGLQFADRTEIFVALVCLFLLVTFTFVKYRSTFVNKLESFFLSAKLDSRDVVTSSSRSQLTLLLAFFTLVTFALSSYLIICHFKGICNEFNILYLFGAFTLLVIVKLILFKIVGYTFFTRQVSTEYSYVYLSIINSLGLSLFFTTVLFVYQAHSWRETLLIVNIVIISLHFIALLVKLFQQFLSKPVALFYIFLYLCTLEILPLMVLIYFVEKFIILV